jgi:xylulokinase
VGRGAGSDFRRDEKGRRALKKFSPSAAAASSTARFISTNASKPRWTTLDPQKSLVENLRGVFARKTSPIWMDSSTATECAEIRKKLGGIKYTASRTGSDAFERFTGPQIRKFYKTEPDDAYKKTSSIALVSSFMASLLAGKIAPIDFGDGAGMNLMDIRKKVGTWTRSRRPRRT